MYHNVSILIIISKIKYDYIFIVLNFETFSKFPIENINLIKKINNDYKKYQPQKNKFI